MPGDKEPRIAKDRDLNGPIASGKLLLTRCGGCKGAGAILLRPSAAAVWETPSIICPDCGGVGYHKGTTYKSNNDLIAEGVILL